MAATTAALAVGAGAIMLTMGAAVVFGGGLCLIQLIGNKDDKYHLVIPPKADVPKGGIRVVIVNQSKSWNKAVRIYQDKDVEQWTEVKAGDSTGKVAKANQNIKYDNKRVEFKEGKTMKLAFMKPAALGIWIFEGGINITPDQIKAFNGRTIYVYFDDAGDKFFENQANLLTMDKLV